MSEPTIAEVRVALGNHGSVPAAAEALGLSRHQLKRLIHKLRPPGTSYQDFVDGKVEEDWRLHADARAANLKGWLDHMMTSTNWPVVNPESLVVEPRIERIYDRRGGGYREVAKSPRTWITDVLRAAPIPDVRGRTFLITGAQNDAPVHDGFWGNLTAYGRWLGADLIVGAWTYETAWFNENQGASRVYDPRIRPHMCFGQMALGDDFLFLGDVNVLPTAARPLSDLTSHSRGRWAVLPHARRALQTLPHTDPSRQGGQISTSMACTRPKVVPRKAGQRAVFHHVVGATIVEFSDTGRVFVRQLSAEDDGSFFDLGPEGLRRVSKGKVVAGPKAGRPEGIVYADAHEAKLSPTTSIACWGFDQRDGARVSYPSLHDTLRPLRAFVHDGFDNESRNHHHQKDAAYQFEMAVRGRESVLEEVGGFAAFLRRLHRPWGEVFVVESNHDIGLTRYVTEGRYRGDGINHRFGLQLELAYADWVVEKAACLDRYAAPPHFSLLELAARRLDPGGTDLGHVTWLYDNTSFKVQGVEHAHHGFRGEGGKPATTNGYTKLGVKISIGDKHRGAILDGVYQAGACELQMGYNKGIQTWSVTHIVQYPNGKRTLVTMQDGAWCAGVPAVTPPRIAAEPPRPASAEPPRGGRSPIRARRATAL